MNAALESLLPPISESQPCGPDLSYDPLLDEIETLLQGAPEVEIGSVMRPAEPPDWRAIKKLCLEFMGRSKHLKVATVFCCATLRVDGFAGLRDGLQLLQHWLETFWSPLYPELDPEDDPPNDPTLRLNLLKPLSSPRGALDGWFKVVDYVYAAPIGSPRGVGPISLEQLRPDVVAGAADSAMDTATLANALRDLGDDALSAQAAVLREALEAVRGIDNALTSILGAGGTISFDVLERSLMLVLSALDGVRGPGGAESGAIAGGSAEAEAGAGGGLMAGAGRSAGGFAGIQIGGTILSRDDVSRALDAVCEYYRQVEPGSPVPFLLRRAQKLAFMDFVDAVQELNIASIDSLRPSMGVALDEAHGSSD